LPQHRWQTLRRALRILQELQRWNQPLLHVGKIAVCAVLIGGVVGRPRMGWALVAGTVLQFLVIAAGVIVPAMYILGVIFAALWVTGIWLARRHTPRPDAP
jgi:hypothetical protein